MLTKVTNSLFQGSIADAEEFKKTHPNEPFKFIGVLGANELTAETPYDTLIPIRTKDNNTRIDITALNQTIDAIKKYHKEGFSVVVFCAAGVERSPLTAIYYLYKTNVLPIREAYQFYRTKRAILATVEQDITDIELAEGGKQKYEREKPSRRVDRRRLEAVRKSARERTNRTNHAI